MFSAPQVNFYVEDIEAAADLYRGLLGFTETFRTPQQGTLSCVLSQPHDFAASLRAVWIVDPEGNPVQIVMRRG